MRDLLRPQKLKKLPQQNLKVREHPKQGPYVEGKDKPAAENDSLSVCIFKLLFYPLLKFLYIFKIFIQ